MPCRDTSGEGSVGRVEEHDQLRELGPTSRRVQTYLLLACTPLPGGRMSPPSSPARPHAGRVQDGVVRSVQLNVCLRRKLEAGGRTSTKIFSTKAKT